MDGMIGAVTGGGVAIILALLAVAYKRFHKQVERNTDTLVRHIDTGDKRWAGWEAQYRADTNRIQNDLGLLHGELRRLNGIKGKG
jgi:hypothetical protein